MAVILVLVVVLGVCVCCPDTLKTIMAQTFGALPTESLRRTIDCLQAVNQSRLHQSKREFVYTDTQVLLSAAKQHDWCDDNFTAMDTTQPNDRTHWAQLARRGAAQNVNNSFQLVCKECAVRMIKCCSWFHADVRLRRSSLVPPKKMQKYSNTWRWKDIFQKWANGEFPQRVTKMIFPRGPTVVKFNFTNSKLTLKHFSTNKLIGKYQTLKSRWDNPSLCTRFRRPWLQCVGVQFFLTRFSRLPSNVTAIVSSGSYWEKRRFAGDGNKEVKS